MTPPSDLTDADRTRQRVPKALVALLCGGAVLRLMWSVYAARPGIGLHDPSLYRIFAERIADGHGYTVLDGSPTAYFPIGYPLTLSVAFALSPMPWHTGVVVLINITAQVLSAGLVYAIVMRLGGARRRPALIAAALVAFWPNLVINSAVALSESLFIVLVLGAVLLVVRDTALPGRMGRRDLVKVGVLLGLATHVRPVTPFLLVVFAVAWRAAGIDWRATAQRVFLIAAVAAAVLAPWVIRNAVVMDAPVLSTNTGDNVCMSRRVGGSGGFEFPNPRCNSGPFDALPRPAYETERDAHGRRLAFEFVREHPVEEVRQWYRRLSYALRWDDDGVAAVESYGEDRFLGATARGALRTISNWYYYAALAAGVVGFGVLARSRRTGALVVVLSPVALLIPVMLTFGDPRFKLPIVPFLAIAAGTALHLAWVRLADLSARRGDSLS